MSRRLSRRTALVVVALISIGFGAGGLVGARLVESPQEAAASRRPPPPSVLTAPVEFRKLVDTLVTRGDVVVGRQVEVSLLGAGDARPVVTGVRVRKGRPVRSGQVVVEVSGRPVIVFAGRVPAYRDLRPGAYGADVRQLQRALRTIGLSTSGDGAGILGPDTQNALRAFYAEIGYEAPTTGNEADVTAAADAVKNSKRSVAAAKQALSRVRSQQPDPDDPRSHQYAIQDAKGALTIAEEDQRDAQSRLDAVRTVSGPMLPLAEFVFVPGLPATVASVAVAVGSPGEGTALSLDLGVPRIRVLVDPTRRDLIRVGMPVTVFVDSLNRELPGTVTRVGPESDDRNGGLAYPLSIACPGLPRSTVGANVRVTATTATTDRKVLVVPVAAVTSSADGHTNVVVRDGSEKERTVRVRPGLSAAGFVEIAPEADARLSEGDQVVVGTS